LLLLLLHQPNNAIQFANGNAMIPNALLSATLFALVLNVK
jgi:hypothetical protein